MKNENSSGKITNEDVIGALQGVIEAQKELIKILGELLAAERAKHNGYITTIVPNTVPNDTGVLPQPYKPYIGDPIPNSSGSAPYRWPATWCQQGSTNNAPDFAKLTKPLAINSVDING